ncbi:3-deoxy-D-manno-octulosonate 8-phosphate phosphatase [Lewinellaceae bacterium SD302]|nr:3-deoxy-D-manno-octulosonate 8-phosphate phosphatase [Lewinellaceae bacterium SD302]
MNQLEKFGEVDTLLFDVDGVMTDSSLHVLENGQLLRNMHTRDGYALKAAVKAGLRVCIITGGKSEGVKIRLQNLGVTDIYVGIQDKLETYEEYVDIYELDEGKILYMGDDLPDLAVMRRVGFPVCPADAAPEIKKISQYVSSLNGGHGCVRDVIERVLKLKGDWT